MYFQHPSFKYKDKKNTYLDLDEWHQIQPLKNILRGTCWPQVATVHFSISKPFKLAFSILWIWTSLSEQIMTCPLAFMTYKHHRNGTFEFPICFAISNKGENQCDTSEFANIRSSPTHTHTKLTADKLMVGFRKRV